MHDINRLTENSHVKSNIVHTLHWIQKVGTLPLDSFRELLTPKELAFAKKLLEGASEKIKTWYPLPRANFLEYTHNVIILHI